ncbi:hypothetical protein T484DRAFT_2615114 [Baffinella frigidus]|nr:hypothetical protein T484DRAFT_2615114 [Cryptophyta sp. CCMP2293]
MRISAVAAMVVFSVTLSAPVRSSIDIKLPIIWARPNHHVGFVDLPPRRMDAGRGHGAGQKGLAQTFLLPLRGGGRRARKFITKDKKAAHTRKTKSREKADARGAEGDKGGDAGGEVRDEAKGGEGEEGGGGERVPEGGSKSRGSWIRNPRLRERFLRRHRQKQGRGAAAEDGGGEARGKAGKAAEEERVIDAMRGIKKKVSKDRGTPTFKVWSGTEKMGTVKSRTAPAKTKDGADWRDGDAGGGEDGEGEAEAAWKSGRRKRGEGGSTGGLGGGDDLRGDDEDSGVGGDSGGDGSEEGGTAGDVEANETLMDFFGTLT